jgi:TolA-binding protein
MTFVDLHPEDLLERERTAELSPAERDRLKTHLAVCAACRFERAVVRDIERATRPRPSDAAMLARGIDKAHARARLQMHVDVSGDGCAHREATRVDGGADALGGRPAPTRDVSRSSPAPLRARSRRAIAVIALVAAAAIAAIAIALGRRAGPRPASDGSASQAASAIAMLPGGESDRFVRTAPEGLAESPATELASPFGSSSAVAGAGSASPRPPPEPTAAELFTQANETRRQGSAAEAARLYRQLLQRHPATREAAASRVALGRLLLDRLGDAAGALSLFDQYLASNGGGTLAEEAALGRAVALMKLGRTADERAAWMTFLERYPHSIHAERARGRLDVIR